MKTTLPSEATARVVARLQRANAAFAGAFPGEPETRQPVHTVYGGAQLFRPDMARKLGRAALRALDEHAPDAESFAAAIGVPPALAATIHARVRAKLASEPVEDFRIDFEDGFGSRPDAEEDETAERTARALAEGARDGALPPFVGIRIKSLAEETRARAIRTLDVFVSTLAAETGGRLPPGFVITLPKVTVADQVSAAVELFELLETGLGLPTNALRLELMIETTQSIVDEEGRFNLPRLLRAAQGRCVAAHFGTYDYTASCNVTAAWQTMDHPACDLARHAMQLAFARTGIFLSDGATNVLPVAVHRPQPGRALSADELADNRASVHAAWKLQYDHVQDSLRRGFYQGWDLHPAQLPVRYAAVYAFFLQGLDAATQRLNSFVAKAAQASVVGDVFDDAATGQGLLNTFLRAINCGAVSEAEVLQRTGLTLEELRLRSFSKILDLRRGILDSSPSKSG